MIFTISGKEIQAERPEPIFSDIELVMYERRMPPQLAAEALVDGSNVLITDFYSSGLSVLTALKKLLSQKFKDPSFKGQRDFRSVYREHSQRLLLFVSQHKLVVKKAPEIGWLKILYPETEDFLLPFPQVQGLNSAWQWYDKGIHMPGLEKPLHPFFGTYFPTRFEHLGLFDHWLSQYKGEKTDAMDIGTGCGVLAFLMLKHQFAKVYGTDTNPNAIIGLHESREKMQLQSKLGILHGDLFADSMVKTELIVFNPPWLPAPESTEGLDRSIYYQEELFFRFFAEAPYRLKEGGRVVLLFSNLAQITESGVSHPIETEILKGGRFRKEVFVQKKVAPASFKTRRNQNWRSSEMVELWVLKTC